MSPLEAEKKEKKVAIKLKNLKATYYFPKFDDTSKNASRNNSRSVTPDLS